MDWKKLGLKIQSYAKEFVDYDYLHKLNPEELEELKKFTAEYYSNNWHGVNPERKELWTMDNCRRRDLYNQSLYLEEGEQINDFRDKEEEPYDFKNLKVGLSFAVEKVVEDLTDQVDNDIIDTATGMKLACRRFYLLVKEDQRRSRKENAKQKDKPDA